MNQRCGLKDSPHLKNLLIRKYLHRISSQGFYMYLLTCLPHDCVWVCPRVSRAWLSAWLFLVSRKQGLKKILERYDADNLVGFSFPSRDVNCSFTASRDTAN